MRFSDEAVGAFLSYLPTTRKPCELLQFKDAYKYLILMWLCSSLYVHLYLNMLVYGNIMYAL